jgi:hypothetical protein
MSVDAGWLLTSAPVVGLAADAVVQIASLNAFGRLPASIAAGALFGFIATAVTTAFALAPIRDFAELAPAWMLALFTYCALAFGYWAFLNLNVTSLRIRLLREILQAPGSISRSDLAERYSGDEFLRRRLHRLEFGSRQLSHVDGRWRLRVRTLYVVACIVSALRALIIPSRATRTRTSTIDDSQSG